MADIKFTFTGDTTNLDKSVQDAIKSLNRMSKEAGSSANEINKAFNKLGQDLVKKVGADKALATIKNQMAAQKAEIEKLTPRWNQLNKAMDEMKGKEITAEQYKQIAEFQELEQTLASLNEAYSQYEEVLVGAEKQSKMFSVAVGDMVYEGTSARNVQMQMYNELKRLAAAGKEQTDEFRALQKAYADLSDMSSDLAEANRHLASDTAKLDAALGGLQAAAGAYSVLTGALEAFGVSSTTAEESQKRLQSAIAITTGLQSVANQFQKQSSVMQGIMIIQDKAAAKAKLMLAAANGKATIAQKIFNAVANANPYVLLATALVTVVGAFTAFAFGAGRAAREQKKAAESALRWSEYTKQAAENLAMLTKAEKDAAQQAVDMANAEGKSKREILTLREKQLEVEQRLAKQALQSGETQKHAREVETNKSLLAQKKNQLATDKALLGDKKKQKMYDGHGNLVRTITQDTIDALQAEIDALQNYIDIGENAIEVQRQLAISAAQLAEERRQLTIEEEKANTTARRTTQDLRDSLETDENAKQRKQIQTNYNLQIEDLKTRLATEKNLTDEQQKEINAQIILLRKNRDKELQQFDRQRLNDQIQIQRDAEAKLRDLSAERLEQETSQTLETIRKKAELEKQARLDELQAQKESWIKEQGGQMDAQGRYTDTSKLTDEQNQYLERAEKNIIAIYGDGVKALGSMVENEIFERYSTALQRAIKDQEKFESEIDFLQGAGKDTSEAERQRNEQALAYMQDVEGGLTPEFKMWIDSLGEMTLKTLESELKKAEESLTALKAKNASTEEIMAAEARIAALNKEIKAAQTDIQRGPKLTAYKNLNKVLGDAASGFEALGQTGNEAFDSLMKNVSATLTSVQNVVGSIQAYVKASIEAEKNAADEGAKAVKSVEKASVILAIIGAVLAIAMKLKGLFEDTGDLTGELAKQVADLRTELAKVRREMALDASANSTIFGENAAENLRQYAQATTDYAEQYKKAVDSMARSGLRASLMIDREGHTILSELSADELAGQIIDIKGLGKSMGNSLNEAINTMLDTTQIQTQKRGWFGLRKAKYDTLRNILDDVDIIGDSDEETIENLKALIATQKNLPDETKQTIEEMIADWETYNDAIEGTKGVLAGFFNDMTNSFAESIKTGFTDGAKAGRQNFKEQVNGMVSDFYLQMRIGERTAQMEKDYTQKMLDATGDTKKQQSIALAYADELNRMYDEELAAYESLQTNLENRGYGLKDALDGTLSGAIKGASQESIDLLSGYCNAVRIQQVDGINIMREQLISLSGIEGNTRSIDNHFASFRREFANSLTQDASRASGVVLN